jgi:hypothetical protein
MLLDVYQSGQSGQYITSTSPENIALMAELGEIRVKLITQLNIESRDYIFVRETGSKKQIIGMNAMVMQILSMKVKGRDHGGYRLIDCTLKDVS